MADFDLLSGLNKEATQQLVLAALGAIDSGERELTAVTATVNALGNTTVYTPTAGKRLRLHWIYTINDPAGTAQALVGVLIGSTRHFLTFGVAKRQRITGGVDEPLVINLDRAGATVAVTAFIEELDP